MISDCGTEFTSNQSKEFFIEKEIVHIKSAPFTPAQNGIIERENRTLMNGVRSMLIHKNAPDILWGEALLTIVYVLNRSVNSITIDKTPFELYIGRKPKVGHVKVFGCISNVKTQIKKRSGYQKKYEHRASKSIFVGYEDYDYTYRVYNLQSKKIIISRDVIYDELTGYSGKTSYSEIDVFINSREDSTSIASDIESEEEEANIIDDEGNITIPQSYKEAIESPERKMWRTAMDEEFESLINNKTWTLSDLPANKKAITGKWIFTLKKKEGKIIRYKARYVARGFSQQAGIDFVETFSPVVRMESVRILLILANHFNLKVRQIDVKTAFIHGNLEEEIFIRQPEGYEQGNKQQVCKLKKAIYGLKQASLAWNKCFCNFLKEFNLYPLKSDTCIFMNKVPSIGSEGYPILIVAIYVDDGLILSNNDNLMTKCIDHIKSRFEIKISKPDNFVGVQIRMINGTLKINQEQYIKDIISKYELNEAKSISIPMASNSKISKIGNGTVESLIINVPYRQLVGSLLYASLSTRPDISYSVNVLSRYCSEPRKAHWNFLKNIVRYLIGKEDYGLINKRGKEISLSCYTDSDHGGCIDTRRSTSGWIILLNSTPIIWKSSRQATTTTSTCESEFVSCSTASKDLLWVRNLLSELGINLKPTPVHIDNQGTIKLIRNNQTHAKTKHLDIKLHFIRDINNKSIQVRYVPSEDNISDLLTKPLPSNKFYKFLDIINLRGEQEVNLAERNIVKPLIIYLTMINTSHCFLLGPEKSVREIEVILGYGNPCQFMIDESLQKEIDDFEKVYQEEQKTGKQLHCRSEKLFQFEACILKSGKLTGTISKFPQVAARIHKRNVISDILDNIIRLSNVVISSGTIWIKSLSKTTISDMAFENLAKQLVSNLMTNGQSDYYNLTLVPHDVIKDEIARVSLYAQKHPEILEDAVKKSKGIDQFLDFVGDEFVAAEILLAGIYKYLKIGKIDTKSLGELAGSMELMDIDPDKTKVKQVLDMPYEHAVKFVFDVVSDIPLTQRIIKSDLLILFITNVVILLLGIISYKLHKQNTQSEPAVVFRGPVENQEFVNLTDIKVKKDQVPIINNPTSSRGDNESLYSVLPMRAHI